MSFRRYFLKNKIKKATEVADAFSDSLSLIHPVFVGIPIITYVVNKCLGCTSEERITERLNMIAYKLQEKKITKDEFKTKIEKVSEYYEYVIRNNLNNIVLTCIPETVDTYIEVLIELILNQETSIYEELCEIINQLNKSDFQLLKMIKEYQNYGTREYYNTYLKKREESKKITDTEVEKSKTMKKVNFQDRSLCIGVDTIFWRDFAEVYGVSGITFEYMLLKEFVVESNDGKKYEWMYIARSFLKLQKLGIIEIDYNTTLETINNLNINRFHITVFGAKLMKYIR